MNVCFKSWIRQQYKILLLTSVIALVHDNVSAQKIVIVTATDYCKTITQDDIKKLYKGEITRVENNQLLFLDHPVNSQVYQDFIKQCFNTSATEIQKYWQRVKLESGKTPPKFLPEAFLPKALKSMKGSISYYYEGQVPEGLFLISQ